jgi:predicted dehydrogenase
MNVAIVGCGKIGEKRANSLQSNDKLVFCVDTDINKAKTLAEKYNAISLFDYKHVCNSKDIDVVIVSTNNNNLFPVAIEAIKNNKHVLIEKPVGINVKEIESLINESELKKVLVRTGFNHRYHPAISKAKEMVNNGIIGDPMFIRARYGHGGRKGYNEEWRSDKKLSGGGELIDQGIHLIDLSRWFIGNFCKVNGTVKTYYWDMSVEDNAFLTLETKDGQVAFLQASCTARDIMFSFEIYGKLGKLLIQGLGGNYGTEKLFYFDRKPGSSFSKTTMWDFPEKDNSWELEWKEFVHDIKLQRFPSVNLYDSLEAMKIVEKIYKENKIDHNS